MVSKHSFLLGGFQFNNMEVEGLTTVTSDRELVLLVPDVEREAELTRVG